MSGGYTQLKNLNSTLDVKKKRCRISQALKAKNRALKKLGSKASDFLAKWEILKGGEDKDRADGFIASLMAQGYSHIEVQSLLKIGGSRVTRLSKPDWAKKKEKRPPPSHAAKENDLLAIREHINTWNIETSYGCQHNSHIEYLGFGNNDKQSSWKELYSEYAKERNKVCSRILSYNRWLDYVRYFRPNLKLNKSSAQSVCGKCFPRDKQHVKDSPVKLDKKKKLKAKSTNEDISNPKLALLNNSTYQCGKNSNVDNSSVYDDGNGLLNTSAEWNPLINVDSTRQRSQDDVNLLNSSYRYTQYHNYSETQVMPPQYQLASNNPEYFTNDQSYYLHIQNQRGYLDLGVNKVLYIPNSSNLTTDYTDCFRHYNEQELVLGRTMKDWLRFSVTFPDSSLEASGLSHNTQSWATNQNFCETARHKLRTSFELFSKLGVSFWTFNDSAVVRPGTNLADTNRTLDEISDLALDLQHQTGIRLLSVICNLSHSRYSNGAATSNDAHVFAYAAAQVKKCLEISKKLGSQNFVICCENEGFLTLLNTDVAMEMNHLTVFLKFLLDYKNKIGFTGQLLLQPGSSSYTKHAYNYDSLTTIGFLERTGLKRHFKLNIDSSMLQSTNQHYLRDVKMASSFGMLGSVSINTSKENASNQSLLDHHTSTLLLRIILQQHGLQPGGMNIYRKVKPDHTDVYDTFIGFISTMDSLAKALKAGAKVVEDGILDRSLKTCYVSFSSGIGKKIEDGATSLEELEQYILEHGEPSVTSSKTEHFEAMFNHYL